MSEYQKALNAAIVYYRAMGAWGMAEVLEKMLRDSYATNY